jgi:hypothetical protein
VTYITGQAVGVGQKGRYRLDRVLGEGGFGRVYLGYDDELRRQVAIKVPTKERFQKPEDAEAYLSEARTVASLDHPHIVPVYDMGRTDDGSVYVISRFIDGRTLEDRIKSGGPVGSRDSGTDRHGRDGPALRPPAAVDPPRRETRQHPDRGQHQYSIRRRLRTGCS